MKTLTRRSFLTRSALAAATVSWSARSWAQVKSANDDVRVAVVGFGQRGQSHIDGFSKQKGVRLVGLCDVDKGILEKETKKWAEKGTEVQSVTDMRKLMENKAIDVISIATPNHWHSLAAIWAVQAGKDVYVEKPVSHNVWEGRQLVKAARKYERIVQTGTQSRSSTGIHDAFAWLREGNLGKILLARALCYKSRPSIGRTEGPQKVPDNIDYDLWSGPAPLVPPRRNSSKWGTIHYDWHWFWNYGNGDLGNQGIHQMDIARWVLGVNELSPRILSLGGRLGYEDDGETPNTQLVYHDYKPAPLLFEVRGLPDKTGGRNMDYFKNPKFGDYKFKNKKGEIETLKPSVAVIVECEGGSMVVPSYTGATAYDHDGKEIKSWSGSTDHFVNFMKAVKSRKYSDLNADILEGHLSSALCHTGNISYRLGKPASPDAIPAALKSHSAVAEAFGRMTEHLAANGVDLEKTKATLGVALTMDPKSERFVGNDAANAMLTRDYRKPYVVPENV
jgi:predicted dehydrogenase